MEGDAKGKTFGLKGHTLPGINQRSEGNKSSTFQFSNMMSAGIAASQAMPTQRRNQPPQGAMGGVGAGVPGMPGAFPSKPSIAKIYNKSKLTKEVLK
jgi:hypothetical protein